LTTVGWKARFGCGITTGRSESAPKSISLTDRAGWQAELELNGFAQQFAKLATGPIAIRPRALVTTMFCRMVLSDIFIHGIGGAKYDQLTDSIAGQFFGAAPPEFMTIHDDLGDDENQE